jgi:hypothetical protein
MSCNENCTVMVGAPALFMTLFEKLTRHCQRWQDDVGGGNLADIPGEEWPAAPSARGYGLLHDVARFDRSLVMPLPREYDFHGPSALRYRIRQALQAIKVPSDPAFDRFFKRMVDEVAAMGFLPTVNPSVPCKDEELWKELRSGFYEREFPLLPLSLLTKKGRP